MFTLAASQAVRNSLYLINDGFPLGSERNPLKIGFAGLLMSSKGLHTIVESLLELKNRGLYVQLFVAGAIFSKHYYSNIVRFLKDNNLYDITVFFGQLSSSQLVRFWQACNISIFPSIHPEAFGIIEAMASGVPLITLE